MKTYIIGHKKPDTDAVVAAMALAHLYKEAAHLGFENPEAVITEELNPETFFLFDKFGIEKPEIISSDAMADEDKVVLVDHNEESQRVDHLDADKIVGIVDHHKVNLNLNSPIEMTFKTWGSSSSIVYDMMVIHNVKPTKELASLMLAAVLSDTVGYKSATTTDNDKEIGDQLAEIAEIDDVDAFTLEIFKAKSDTASLSDEDIVKNDYKVFEFDKKTLINQIETVEPDVILKRKEGLIEAMETLRVDEDVELVFCAVSDILKVNTKLILLSEMEANIAQKAFGGEVEDNILDIGAKLSRKKEIAPPLEEAIK